MAVQQNGKPREGSKANGYISHRPAAPRRIKPASARGGVSNRLLSNSLRLLLWYVVITAFFRCPADTSDLDVDSPKICHPYLIARSYIQPQIDPYYQKYAAPYVDVARPYAQEVDNRVIKPASRFAKSSYHAYGAPALQQSKQYSQEQWKTTIAPQIEIAKAKLFDVYESSVSPYTEKVYVSLEPYYESTRETAVYLHQKHVAPTYAAAKPYAENAYASGHAFLTETGIPASQRAWSSLIIFVEGKLWPSMKGLYNQNVEPQLVLIGERLARYRESRKIKSAMKEATSTSVVSVPPLETAIPSSTESAAQDETQSQTEEAPAEKTSMTPTEQIAAAREKIASDLYTWQEKFAVAADNGVDHLTERVQNIMESLISSEVNGVAKGLSTALDHTAKKQLAELRTHIKDTITQLPVEADGVEVEAAENQIFGAVRSAGMAIRERAHALRKWYESFELMVNKRASDASGTTLDVLDNIRDLGLQEIGMRWAWMDGVTYQDWAKYHELKRQFESWRTEVEDVAMKHKSLEQAKALGAELVSDAMEIAEKAAKELVRLKEVGKWKLQARDSSDNFEIEEMPPAAISVGSSLAENVKEASESLAGSGEGSAKSIISDATSTVAEALSAASSAILSKSPGIVNEASSNVVSAAAAASEAAGQETDQVVEKVEHLSASATSAFQEGAGPSGSEPEPVVSEINEPVKNLADDGESSVSSSTEASSMVWSGAMAQEVSGRKPILDDILDDEGDNFSERLQNVISDAGDRYAEVTKAVSEALLGPTQGTGESIASVASDRYSSAIAAASSALYGSSEGVMESIGNAAADKYANAVSTASSILYGTPTPVIGSLYDQASSSYSDATSRAAEQYTRALSIASSHISGSPKPVHEAMLSSVKAAYSGSLDAAQERFEAAKNVAQSQYAEATSVLSGFASTPTSGPLESISSIASARLQAGLTSASAQYSSAKAALGPRSTSLPQSLLQEAQRRYYEAVGMAHDRYSEFVQAGSSIMYGTSTPLYESAYSAASEAVHGTTTPANQAIMDAAHSRYHAASSVAAASLAAAVSSVQSVAGASSKPPSQEVLSYASAQYETALGAASSSLSAASSSAKAAFSGTTTGNVESITAQAAQNWEALVSKASEQVYGAPTPFADSVASQAGVYSAQVTEAVLAQYSAVQGLVSELLVGREPDFTESVINRLSSVIHTGYHVSIATSASSFASEAYHSASSVVSTYFTPPPTIEAIIQAANDQLNSAVDAASIGIFGSSTGNYEKATSAAADKYNSAASAASEQYEAASSRVSEAIYGTQTAYSEAAISSISNAMSSARDAISSAIYGTPTGSVESVGSAVSSGYASISSNVADSLGAAKSVAEDAYSSGKARISEAIYGPEEAALESAQRRLSDAVESAQAKIAAFARNGGDKAASVVEAAKSSIDDFASNVGSAASSITNRVKDEL